MRSTKRKLSREELDDEKFRMEMNGVKFRERIEREANKAIMCPRCGGSDFEMEPKCWVNIAENGLLATMVCRKCHRRLPYGTYMEEPYPDDKPYEELSEDERDELDFFVNVIYGKLGVTDIHPVAAEMIKNRIRRRIARMSLENRFRLLAYLR